MKTKSLACIIGLFISTLTFVGCSNSSSDGFNSADFSQKLSEALAKQDTTMLIQMKASLKVDSVKARELITSVSDSSAMVRAMTIVMASNDADAVAAEFFKNPSKEFAIAIKDCYLMIRDDDGWNEYQMAFVKQYCELDLKAQAATIIKTATPEEIALSLAASDRELYEEIRAQLASDKDKLERLENAMTIDFYNE